MLHKLGTAFTMLCHRKLRISRSAYMADATLCSKLSNPNRSILASISQQVRAEVCKFEHCDSNFCIPQNVLHACTIQMAKVFNSKKKWQTTRRRNLMRCSDQTAKICHRTKDAGDPGRVNEQNFCGVQDANMIHSTHLQNSMGRRPGWTGLYRRTQSTASMDCVR